MFLLRQIFALFSLLILAAAGYLLWTWYQGDWVRDAAGALVKVRHDWMLWTGAALLAWSLLGRFVVRLLLARTDQDPMRVERGIGQMLDSPSGARLHVETFGSVDAPPLVLVHGWSQDSRMWFYAKRDLARQFRVIVWDLPGLGKSKRPAGGRVCLSNFAQDLAAVVAFAGRPAVVVGHSIGGMTIQTLARDRPELFGREVMGVVLCNTTYVNPLKTMVLSGLARAIRWPILEPMMRLNILLLPFAWASSWQSYFSGSTHVSTRLGFGKYVTRSQLDASAWMMTVNSPAVSARGDLAMFRWDSELALADADVPTLVIGGDIDILTKLEASRTIASATSGRLMVVEGVNHMGPVERADLYNDAIAAFAGPLLTAPA
ncbi:alpha/beta fold hydrolase [Sphingomonas sp. PB4P5]|uniref:alpha/beta fold hydrolase n=1 Tax=Parasphingomonas puruogangriensis TaxID=3096155 RepID=UPI002FC999F4